MQWTLEREGVNSAVLAMDNFDVTGDGVKDLIVGRHDGGVEVKSLFLL
jgi:Bardet-Biedl syndrome 7 protein